MRNPVYWLIGLYLLGTFSLAACSAIPISQALDPQPVENAVETQLAAIVSDPVANQNASPTSTLTPTTLPSKSLPDQQDLSGLFFSSSEFYQFLSDGSVKTIYPGQILTLAPDQKSGLINTNGDFWLAQFDTQALSRLTMTENRVECCAVWWNNHPDKILFLSNTLGGNQGVATNGFLTVIRQDGTGYLVLDPDHPTAGAPALSPDGVWIAYGYGPTGWLFGGELGPQKIDPAEYGLVSLKGQNISHPAWSPDGRHLAWLWQSDLNSGSKLGILVLDMVEKSYRLSNLFSPAPGIVDTSILWSPDGKWISYQKNTDKSGLSGTYLIQATSPGLEEISIAPSGIIPQIWTPDSQKLVFISDQAPDLGAFYIYDLASQTLTNLGLGQYQAGKAIAWGQ